MNTELKTIYTEATGYQLRRIDTLQSKLGRFPTLEEVKALLRK